MAIIGMFGFDQFDQIPLNSNSSSILINAMAYQNYPFQMMYGSNSSYGIKRDANGKKWLQFATGWSSGASPNSRINNYLSAIFGANAAKTKWFIGCRVNVENKTSVSWNPITLGGSTSVTWGISANDLALGEQYLEICIDWVNKVIRRWVDGVELTQQTFTSIDPAAVQLSFGIGSSAADQTAGVSIADIYLIVDTSDVDGGTTQSTRLGPVRVKNLDVDQAILPADWSKTQRSNNLVQSGGVTYDCITRNWPAFVPSGGVNVTPIYADTKLTSVPNPSAYLYSGSNGLYALTRQDAFITFYSSSPAFTYELPVPRKVTGYTLGHGSANTYYCISKWRLDASNDGTNWTTLHDQTADQSTALRATTNMVIPLDPAVVAAYKFYRLTVTGVSATGTNGTVILRNFTLLCDAADPFYSAESLLNENIWYDGANSSVAVSGKLATSISDSEAGFSIKAPATPNDVIKKVQLRLTGYRDGGSSEHLVVKAKKGTDVSAELNYTLNTDLTRNVVVVDMERQINGQPWTSDDVDQLQLLVKSKAGV